MGIIGDVISAAEVEAKVQKLKNCKRDLSDDGTSVSVFNKAIDRIATDAQSMLGTQGSRAIVNKLNAYMEPNQSSDSVLENARTYIQREINYLDPSGNGSW